MQQGAHPPSAHIDDLLLPIESLMSRQAIEKHLLAVFIVQMLVVDIKRER